MAQTNWTELGSRLALHKHELQERRLGRENVSSISEMDELSLLNFPPVREDLRTAIPLTVIFALLLITGCIGNLCTAIVIARPKNKYMHTATNYYLFSLAMSDFLFLILGLPQEMFDLWQKYPYAFNECFCIVRGFLSEASTYASILTISAFTVERYVAICHPLWAHTMSQLPRAITSIVIIWCLAALCAIPPAAELGLIFRAGPITNRKLELSAQCARKNILFEYMFLVSAIAFFIIPMLIVTVLYILIALELRRSSKMNESMNKRRTSSGQSQQMNSQNQNQNQNQIENQLQCCKWKASNTRPTNSWLVGQLLTNCKSSSTNGQQSKSKSNKKRDEHEQVVGRVLDHKTKVPLMTSIMSGRPSSAIGNEGNEGQQHEHQHNKSTSHSNLAQSCQRASIWAPNSWLALFANQNGSLISSNTCYPCASCCGCNSSNQSQNQNQKQIQTQSHNQAQNEQFECHLRGPKRQQSDQFLCVPSKSNLSQRQQQQQLTYHDSLHIGKHKLESGHKFNELNCNCDSSVCSLSESPNNNTSSNCHRNHNCHHQYHQHIHLKQQHHKHSQRRLATSSNKRSVIRMLVAVVVSFFICWLPFHAQRLLAAYVAKDENQNQFLLDTYFRLTYVSGVMYYLSSTINPLLYQLMSAKFRLAFKETFRCSLFRCLNSVERDLESSLRRASRQTTASHASHVHHQHQHQHHHQKHHQQQHHYCPLHQSNKASIQRQHQLAESCCAHVPRSGRNSLESAASNDLCPIRVKHNRASSKLKRLVRIFAMVKSQGRRQSQQDSLRSSMDSTCCQVRHDSLSSRRLSLAKASANLRRHEEEDQQQAEADIDEEGAQAKEPQDDMRARSVQVQLARTLLQQHQKQQKQHKQLHEHEHQVHSSKADNCNRDVINRNMSPPNAHHCDLASGATPTTNSQLNVQLANGLNSPLNTGSGTRTTSASTSTSNTNNYTNNNTNNTNNNNNNNNKQDEHDDDDDDADKQITDKHRNSESVSSLALIASKTQETQANGHLERNTLKPSSGSSTSLPESDLASLASSSLNWAQTEIESRQALIEPTEANSIRGSLLLESMCQSEFCSLAKIGQEKQEIKQEAPKKICSLGHQISGHKADSDEAIAV